MNYNDSSFDKEDVFYRTYCKNWSVHGDPDPFYRKLYGSAEQLSGTGLSGFSGYLYGRDSPKHSADRTGNNGGSPCNIHDHFP